MPRPAKLAPAEVTARLSALPGWSIAGGKLHRELIFPDFAQAFAFMGEVARDAEALQHHPEWFNVYNRVVIDLTTHDAGGITSLDFDLARRAEEHARHHARPAS
jgi:4a-hydroxytetrahydrobiopterin dehydratase